ncbi:flagellin domain protein [Desulfurobacterium thermolithotrophum DSM 11699]|uniref:Flagellin n=1 Tax=Desulfurobacterium thermolithotrophum (strain DSM 11699 / BSA) TaxID=868864 RepID=F0S151_DESTD|nr:flagellin [Desulfurobacterium thermolithotrophum]ADY73929.1 flagellin domain protein [Desulfurobacterium thermolithotrophum DSM 11699]
MALRINYNYQSDFTHFNLLQTEANMNKSLERLATGYRINRAADDAAGLYIADQLKTYAVSLEQATRNAHDGISIAQIAQSALTNVYNILNDIKAKAIEAANDSQDSATRQIIQQDINKLVDVIGKIFTDTEFNGINVFSSGTAVTFTIHYGGRSGQELLMQGATASAAAAADTSAPSTITLGNTGYTLDVTSQTKAEATISTVDALIKEVDKLNAKYGSYQIELEKLITNNESQRINSQEAESRIRNVDFAKEMSEFTRNQILMQSGTAMLAQANQLPQLVLQLLR